MLVACTPPDRTAMLDGCCSTVDVLRRCPTARRLLSPARTDPAANVLPAILNVFLRTCSRITSRVTASTGEGSPPLSCYLNYSRSSAARYWLHPNCSGQHCICAPDRNQSNFETASLVDIFPRESAAGGLAFEGGVEISIGATGASCDRADYSEKAV